MLRARAQARPRVCARTRTHARRARAMAAPAARTAAVPESDDASPFAPGAPIYADYNATTPVAAAVSRAMAPYLFAVWGNPSSGHAYGREAKAAVESARARLSAALGAPPSDASVTFTSGGTESNNWAIRGGCRAMREADGARNHIVTTAVEHPAVAEVVAYLVEKEGFEATYVGVGADGVASAADIAAAVRPGRTAIVTVMHSNNETGALMPVREAAAAARAAGALSHTDASQSVGKVEVDFAELGVDLLTVAGHKLYAPKGVGALVARRDAPAQPERFMIGAGHEGGRRAGTENIILNVGLGAAAELACGASPHERVPEARARLHALRERLREALFAALEREGVEARVNGPAEAALRLPNTLSVSVRGVVGAHLVEACSDKVAFSSGSACHAGAVSMSPVLAAMGVAPEWGDGTVRLSVGKYTTEAEVDAIAEAVAAAAGELARGEKSRG